MRMVEAISNARRKLEATGCPRPYGGMFKARLSEEQTELLMAELKKNASFLSAPPTIKTEWLEADEEFVAIVDGVFVVRVFGDGTHQG